MIGATLAELVSQLRAEIGASPNTSQGQNSVSYWKQVLARTQRTLYARRIWEHLWIHRDINLIGGQRYYNFPTDLKFDQIREVFVKYSTQWEPVIYGIGPAEYNASDPEASESDSPVMRWNHYNDGARKIEVWPQPVSSNEQVLRIYGYKELSPLSNDDHTADLDNDLIVLFAASEVLERMGAKDARAKAALAQSHYNSLIQNDSKSPPFIMGGKCPPANASFASMNDSPIRVARV